jgi:uncharacterized protein (TIGR02217 family)
MPRINERIAECVSLQFTGGPRYRTETARMDNGVEVRDRKWLYPRHEYQAEFLNFSPEARDEIIAFQHVAAGSWLDFRFKDWMDFEAVNEPLSPLIGTATPVQLVKTYTKGAYSSQRIVQAIVSAEVSRNGSPVAGTLDLEMGLFTPTANWVAGTFTWSGEFDVWVHFTEDYNPFTATDISHWTAPILLEESRQ